MRAGKQLIKGAILVEVALSLLINIPILIGGMEYGWYLYVRQGFVSAAGQAVRKSKTQAHEDAALICLHGFFMPQRIIDATIVNTTTLNQGGGVRINQVTVSVPLSEALLFPNDPVQLLGLSDGTITESATGLID